ncbi:hypothetical protein BRC78_02695 [Halobacteriales archaeon QH_8_68_33]|nr:MAG: hypothetical protein BRC78_02695 [Halobacteriales archaeon QH_8_68_33]
MADLYVPFFEERFDADPETALDVACGAGRHVIAFVDRGLDAEGLDFSERFLDEARERELSDNAAFRHHDMRELDEVTGSYDLVTSFWNSLGYYDRATDERVFEFVAGAETAVIYMTVEDLLTDDVRVAGARARPTASSPS